MHFDTDNSINTAIRKVRHALADPGFAVKIPFSSTKDIPVLNLRSVIVRTANKEKIRVSTSSDDENFYVWKT